MRVYRLRNKLQQSIRMLMVRSPLLSDVGFRAVRISASSATVPISRIIIIVPIIITGSIISLSLRYLSFLHRIDRCFIQQIGFLRFCLQINNKLVSPTSLLYIHIEALSKNLPPVFICIELALLRFIHPPVIPAHIRFYRQIWL